jgi:hypothetical protein
LSVWSRLVNARSPRLEGIGGPSPTAAPKPRLGKPRKGSGVKSWLSGAFLTGGYPEGGFTFTRLGGRASVPYAPPGTLQVVDHWVVLVNGERPIDAGRCKPKACRHILSR